MSSVLNLFNGAISPDTGDGNFFSWMSINTNELVVNANGATNGIVLCGSPADDHGRLYVSADTTGIFYRDKNNTTTNLLAGGGGGIPTSATVVTLTDETATLPNSQGLAALVPSDSALFFNSTTGLIASAGVVDAADSTFTYGANNLGVDSTMHFGYNNSSTAENVLVLGSNNTLQQAPASGNHVVVGLSNQSTIVGGTNANTLTIATNSTNDGTGTTIIGHSCTIQPAASNTTILACVDPTSYNLTTSANDSLILGFDRVGLRGNVAPAYTIDGTNSNVSNSDTACAIALSQSTTPPPTAGSGGVIYVKNDVPTSLHYIDSAGTDHEVVPPPEVAPTYPISSPAFAAGELLQYSSGLSKFVNVPNALQSLTYQYQAPTATPATGNFSIVDGPPPVPPAQQVNTLYLNRTTLSGQIPTGILSFGLFDERLTGLTSPINAAIRFRSNGSVSGAIYAYQITGVDQSTFTAGDIITIDLIPTFPVYSDAAANVKVGNFAGASLNQATSTNTTIFGDSAMRQTSTGTDSTAFGAFALEDMPTAIACTAIGAGAMRNAVTATNCVAVGGDSLATLNGGNFNVGIGYACGNELSTGGQNVLVGSNIFIAASGATNANNVAIGHACGTNAVGSSNVLLGASACSALTGSDNVFIGAGAQNGLAVAGTADNVVIGSRSGVAGTTPTGNIVLGSEVTCTGSNNIILDSTGSTTSFTGNGSLVIAGITSTDNVTLVGGTVAIGTQANICLTVFVNGTEYRLPLWLPPA